MSGFEAVTGDAPVAQHAEAEGTDAPDALDESPREYGGRRQWWREALLDAPDDSPRLSEIDTLWNPEDGGMRRVSRGVLNIFGRRRLPPVVDIPLGVLEEVYVWLSTDLVDRSEAPEAQDEQTQYR